MSGFIRLFWGKKQFPSISVADSTKLYFLLKLRVGRESTPALFCCRCLLSGIRAEEAVPIWGMAKGNEEWQCYESVSKPPLGRGQISSLHISFSIASDKVKSHIRGLGKCIKYLKSTVQSITTTILYLRRIPYSIPLPLPQTSLFSA